MWVLLIYLYLEIDILLTILIDFFYLYILDSEWSDECIDFTMMCFFFLCLSIL
jgi:hypothetical protein